MSTDEIADGHTVAKWERIGDDFLLELLVLLDKHRQAIGSLDDSFAGQPLNPLGSRIARTARR
jgi:hypothetical protein